MTTTQRPFSSAPSVGAQVLTLTVPPCACALCQPTSPEDIRTCHAGMSDEEREDHIKGFGADAQLFKDMASHATTDDDRAYWCEKAFRSTQARDALIAGRK